MVARRFKEGGPGVPERVVREPLRIPDVLLGIFSRGDAFLRAVAGSESHQLAEELEQGRFLQARGPQRPERPTMQNPIQPALRFLR